MRVLTRLIALVAILFAAPAFAQVASSGPTTSNGALESGGNLAAINAAVNSQIPAGGNVIGKVGIDQTVPGVTNAVQPADSSYLGPASCSSSCNGTTLLGPIDTTGYKSMQFPGGVALMSDANAANQSDVAAVMACMATAKTYAARVACAVN